jgi:chromosome partitioning protein
MSRKACVCVAVANQKGGVGKTTSTYNLAAAIAKTGKTVLMIDMDPQYSLTLSCAMMPDDPSYKGMSTCSLFRKNIDPLDCCFEVEPLAGKYKLFIVPSTQELAVTSKKLFTRINSISVFKANIDELTDYFDYIFFDCPPSLDELLTSALISSDEVIIPTRPEKLSMSCLDLIIPTIKAVQEAPEGRGNKDLKIKGIIATMYRSAIPEHRDNLEKLAATGYDLLGVIPLSTIVSKDVGLGLPCTLAHPASNPSKAYVNIANSL